MYHVQMCMYTRIYISYMDIRAYMHVRAIEYVKYQYHIQMCMYMYISYIDIHAYMHVRAAEYVKNQMKFYLFVSEPGSTVKLQQRFVTVLTFSC